MMVLVSGQTPRPGPSAGGLSERRFQGTPAGEQGTEAVKAPEGRGGGQPSRPLGLWDIRGVGEAEAPVGRGSRGGAARSHQLLQLPLPVAQLLVHALPHARALQGRDDLQLRVVVVDDVVLQHQAQDLPRPGGASPPAGTPGRAAPPRLRGPNPQPVPRAPRACGGPGSGRPAIGGPVLPPPSARCWGIACPGAPSVSWARPAAPGQQRTHDVARPGGWGSPRDRPRSLPSAF